MQDQDDKTKCRHSRVANYLTSTEGDLGMCFDCGDWFRLDKCQLLEPEAMKPTFLNRFKCLLFGHLIDQNTLILSTKERYSVPVTCSGTEREVMGEEQFQMKKCLRCWAVIFDTQL